MTEPTPERLQEAMDKFGLTEKEARVFIHLEEAEKLFDELRDEVDPVANLGRIIWAETHTHEHFNALYRRLGMLVLRRNYPEGWGHVPPENDQD